MHLGIISNISQCIIVHTLRIEPARAYCTVCLLQQLLWGWPKKANHLSEMGFAKIHVALGPTPIKERGVR